MVVPLMFVYVMFVQMIFVCMFVHIHIHKVYRDYANSTYTQTIQRLCKLYTYSTYAYTHVLDVHTHTHIYSMYIHIHPPPPTHTLQPVVEGASFGFLKATVTCPPDAHTLDVVFSDSGELTGGFYDNNKGLDYHIPVEGGSGASSKSLHVVHVTVEMAPIAKVGCCGGGVGCVLCGLFVGYCTPYLPPYTHTHTPTQTSLDDIAHPTSSPPPHLHTSTPPRLVAWVMWSQPWAGQYKTRDTKFM